MKIALTVPKTRNTNTPSIKIVTPIVTDTLSTAVTGIIRVLSVVFKWLLLYYGILLGCVLKSPPHLFLSKRGTYSVYFIFCYTILLSFSFNKNPQQQVRGILNDCFYLILLNSFLFNSTNFNILDSTHGEISFHQWFGTGNVVLPFEKITCDHFCLTISNHNFINFVLISRNLYGILYFITKQLFFNFLLKTNLLWIIIYCHIYYIF